MTEVIQVDCKIWLSDGDGITIGGDVGLKPLCVVYSVGGIPHRLVEWVKELFDGDEYSINSIVYIEQIIECGEDLSDDIPDSDKTILLKIFDKCIELDEKYNCNFEMFPQ
jgi:hypothetical protein